MAETNVKFSLVSLYWLYYVHNLIIIIMISFYDNVFSSNSCYCTVPILASYRAHSLAVFFACPDTQSSLLILLELYKGEVAWEEAPRKAAWYL